MFWSLFLHKVRTQFVGCHVLSFWVTAWPSALNLSETNVYENSDACELRVSAVVLADFFLLTCWRLCDVHLDMDSECA